MSKIVDEAILEYAGSEDRARRNHDIAIRGTEFDYICNLSHSFGLLSAYSKSFDFDNALNQIKIIHMLLMAYEDKLLFESGDEYYKEQ